MRHMSLKNSLEGCEMKLNLSTIFAITLCLCLLFAAAAWSWTGYDSGVFYAIPDKIYDLIENMIYLAFGSGVTVAGGKLQSKE